MFWTPLARRAPALSFLLAIWCLLTTSWQSDISHTFNLTSIYLKVFQQTGEIDFVQILLPFEPPGLPGLVLLLDGRDAGQPALHQVEGVTLRQQHQQAVHGRQQLVVSIQQLQQSSVTSRDIVTSWHWTHLHPDEGEYWRLQELDESVELCEHVDCDLLLSDGGDDVPSVGVAAGQETEGEGRHLDMLDVRCART